MLKTRLTELLGIELPILGGTMMDLSTAPFVAAISNAGCLGILCSAMLRTPDRLREEIRRTKDLTDRPFAVNINLFPAIQPADNEGMVRVMVEEGVTVVETSGIRAPEDLIPLFRQHGMTWLHKCVGVRYARKAAALGADAVTVVGYENGGATGQLNVATLVLVPSVVDAVSAPVVGGGGVVDGRTLHAVLALGAEGAVVGTRFLLSEECPCHPDLKRALCAADELSTDLIMWSVGFTHRVWMNGPAERTLEIEKRGGGLDEILPYVSGEAARRMYETGDLEAGTVSCSQAVGLIRKVMPVGDIVAEMIEQAGETHRRLGRLGLA